MSSNGCWCTAHDVENRVYLILESQKLGVRHSETSVHRGRLCSGKSWRQSDAVQTTGICCFLVCMQHLKQSLDVNRNSINQIHLQNVDIFFSAHSWHDVNNYNIHFRTCAVESIVCYDLACLDGFYQFDGTRLVRKICQATQVLLDASHM